MGCKKMMKGTDANLQVFGVLLIMNTFVLCLARRINIPTVDWVVKEASYTRLCNTKKILTVNGQFPGPTLRLHQGDRININVHNQGEYGVTLHWHGVKQPRNSWSDGPEYVTQCPVKPGDNYTYEVILSDEEGTLWWHAHSDWTRATVHGAIYIYPRRGRIYPFPKPHGEIPIIIGSWYNYSLTDMLKTALSTGSDTNASDAYTINGQPGDTKPCSAKDMFRATVEHGKSYLLRIINSVMNHEMFVAVAGHKLTVVAVDASYVKPFDADFVMITPGQTMDVLVVTAAVAIGYGDSYYIASRAYGELMNSTTTAVLQYNNNNTSFNGTAASFFPYLPAYNDNSAANSFVARLRSLGTRAYDVPKTVDKRLFITLSVGTLPCNQTMTTTTTTTKCAGPKGNRVSASLNNITFHTPSTIDLLQAYYNYTNNVNGSTSVYKADFPDRPERWFNFVEDPMLGDNLTMSEYSRDGPTRVVMIEYNSTVEIVFQGTNVMNVSENHPMHLHGYSFYLVGLGNSGTLFDADKDPHYNYNLVDPPKLNTVGVPTKGWAAIRFKANNPGVWFMHCHLERHATWGMDTVLIVKNGPTPATSLRTPRHITPCT